MPNVSTDLRVRDAIAGDAVQLSGLLHELGYVADAATLVARLQMFERVGETALVAERDGRLLGVITVHITPVLHRPTAVGRISMLVVARDVRGSGVGRRLVAEAERIVRERDCVLIEVTSNNRRADAHAFYQRLGYEATSTRFKKDLDAPIT